MNIYTGAGVAAGDINNDGLTDLYFSGNQVPGRLYLNKGGLKFEDITEKSGVSHTRWGTGVAMVDINHDGWLDIYVCVSGSDSVSERANLLYVNNGDNTFTEKASAYGIADTRQTMHAAFFDYDLDGDLDLFLLVNPASYARNVNNIQERKLHGESESTDILYRNNGNDTFTDVSKEAGILIEGYGLGLAISDINSDGWPDVYISNDFITNDILYINNQDGTFSNQIDQFLKHTSYAGMGNDIADFNNDGLVDIIELDMRPEDNFRQKLIIPSSGYDRFEMSLKMGYGPQYTRNTMQLNQGNGKFSEISFLSGVSSTDWSWAPLFADFDNDGDKDLFITNGFLRDLGNMDYITYQNVYNTPMGSTETKIQNKLGAIKQLKGALLKDYLYENVGGFSFADRSEAWGIDKAGISHGAVYADLDNDGDLDIVVNNMNEEAHVYENKCNDNRANHYLKIKFKGPLVNGNGIGSKIYIYNQGHNQFYEHFLSRGYESSVDPVMHIGLGEAMAIDSLTICWPDGKSQSLKNIQSDQSITLKYADAHGMSKVVRGGTQKMFHDVSGDLNLVYRHRENDYVDFKNQPLLPHGHSKNGPGITVGDINGDGLDDFYIGGATGYSGRFFLQNSEGTFNSQNPVSIDSLSEDMGVLLFDADRDGDLDIYIASGGSDQLKGSALYQDGLYLNDGKGNFSSAPAGTIPTHKQSGSCVVSSDFDRDGDLDIFVGGRIVPGEYPFPEDSYLYRNDTKSGKVLFTDVTQGVAPGLLKLGLVSSALWSDYDNDGWMDLVVVGEFMPIKIFHNEKGKLVDGSEATGLKNISGWWNSLVSGDFDHDGDIDYIAGNLGLNSRYTAKTSEPLCIFAKDFDKNGEMDPIMTHYMQGERYILHSRDELISQISAMRVRFRTYSLYAETNFEDSFLPEELESAYTVCAQHFESSYIENQGGGKFVIKSLPIQAQFSSVYGMVVEDYNGDGNLDVLITGNSYATEVSTGRHDASIGLYLQGDGRGGFSVVNAMESGFVVDGDAKGIASLIMQNGQELILSGINSGKMKVHTFKEAYSYYRAAPKDVYAKVYLKNGQQRRHEFHYGSSYLSQSSRSLRITKNMIKVEVFDQEGKGKEVYKEKAEVKVKS